MPAVPSPSPPGPVERFIAALLSAIKDNLATCSTCMDQDSISVGSCEMAKFAGTCDGYCIRNCCVSLSFAGLSNAMGWTFPRSLPSNERRSATTLSSPFRCWDAKQHWYSVSKVAIFRATWRWARCAPPMRRPDGRSCGATRWPKCCGQWPGCSSRSPRTRGKRARYLSPSRGTPTGC
jgi:hypothetical protein